LRLVVSVCLSVCLSITTLSVLSVCLSSLSVRPSVRHNSVCLSVLSNTTIRSYQLLKLPTYELNFSLIFSFNDFDSATIDVQTLRAELLQTLQQEFNSTINTLSQTVTSLRAEVLSLRTSARPKPTLPDPDKFDGKAYHFDTWLPSIKAKLWINGPAIGNTTT
jgi:hypothetical protein